MICVEPLEAIYAKLPNIREVVCRCAILVLRDARMKYQRHR